VISIAKSLSLHHLLGVFQENMEKLKEHNATLREKLHEQQDRLHGDVAELKQVYHDNHSRLEKDKNEYKEKFNKVTSLQLPFY
jgi:predicted RNase H-like nuclease (RuvC/YqgF family)